MLPTTLLRDRAFGGYLVASLADRFCSNAMTVLLGFQVYALSHSALDLGWLGLAEAIPGVSLVLYGGHVADRHSRRLIALVGYAALAVFAAGIALASLRTHGGTFAVLLLLAFLAGVARAFVGPALSGLEAQVVPAAAVLPGISFLATTGQLASTLGPAAGGFAWSALGSVATYATIACLFALAFVAVLVGIPERLPPGGPPDERGAGKRIAEGVTYVLRDQILLGSMALDLFAVFFGGATALLPIFATDILHVGPLGFGFLRSASSAGAMIAALTAARFLPAAHAGRTLLAVIAGFGCAIIVFGLSRSLLLSLAALFVAGLCDGISVVIRRAIIRLASPEAMRGRIAAVKSVFVGSSNELGAFESGIAASLFGATAAVWGGGLVTLAVVAGTALLAPRLRTMDLLQLEPPAETLSPAETLPP